MCRIAHVATMFYRAVSVKLNVCASALLEHLVTMGARVIALAQSLRGAPVGANFFPEAALVKQVANE